MKTKYVITCSEGTAIVVNLTGGEANAIEKFIDWACLVDDYAVESIEDYEAEEWGQINDQR